VRQCDPGTGRPPASAGRSDISIFALCSEGGRGDLVSDGSAYTRKKSPRKRGGCLTSPQRQQGGIPLLALRAGRRSTTRESPPLRQTPRDSAHALQIPQLFLQVHFADPLPSGRFVPAATDTAGCGTDAGVLEIGTVWRGVLR
jgi:hypothetical protein